MPEPKRISFEMLGAMICKRMTDLGWTVKDLAKHTGISTHTLVRLRSGKISQWITQRSFKVLSTLGIGLQYGYAPTSKEIVGRQSHELRIDPSLDRRRKSRDQVQLADGRLVTVPKGYGIGHVPAKKPVDYSSLL